MANNIEFKVGLTEEEFKKLSNAFPEQFDKVFIDLGTIQAVSDLKKDLTIDERDLVSSMLEHSGRYGWWASLNVTAEKLLKNLKRDIHKTRSMIDLQARTSIKESGVRVTEDGVQAWIDSDPRSKKDTEKLSMLENVVEYTNMVLKAFEHKRDMLKEINRFKCSERFNEN